jgi:hypothetical protein
MNKQPTTIKQFLTTTALLLTLATPTLAAVEKHDIIVKGSLRYEVINKTGFKSIKLGSKGKIDAYYVADNADFGDAEPTTLDPKVEKLCRSITKSSIIAREDEHVSQTNNYAGVTVFKFKDKSACMFQYDFSSYKRGNNYGTITIALKRQGIITDVIYANVIAQPVIKKTVTATSYNTVKDIPNSAFGEP